MNFFSFASDLVLAQNLPNKLKKVSVWVNPHVFTVGKTSVAPCLPPWDKTFPNSGVNYFP